MSCILVQEGVEAQTSGILFKAVFKAVFLFRSETWVLDPIIGRELGGLHHRVDQRLTGRQPMRKNDRRWDFPHLKDTMRESGSDEVEVYIN